MGILLPIIQFAYRENFIDFCLSDESLSDKYECLFEPINNTFLPIKIFAYQHLCLSLISSVWCICNTQIRLLISFYLLADFWQVFLQIFSKKFSPEKQTLNTKSLLRAENQTRNCKTIFQKSTKSKEKTKSQNPKNALNADNLKFFSRLLREII